MSALDPVAQEIVVLSRSGYPLIHCTTQEELRAIRTVKEAALASQKTFAMWSVSQGYNTDDPASDRKGVADRRPRAPVERHSPEEALATLASMKAPGLVVLLDFHHFLSEPMVARQLCDSLPTLVERGQSVVVISPHWEWPTTLEKEVAVIDLPLPGIELLRSALLRVAHSEKVVLQEAVIDRAARSALGLSLHEAQRVFRKVMVLRGGLAISDLSLLVEEKKHHLQRSDTLKYYPLREGLEDLGGLGELKRWLTHRTSAFGDEARAFGLPPPKGLLLLGVQGCGKSLSAKVVANLWSFPLLRLDVGVVFGGEGGDAPEVSMRHAIKIAERLAPVVLWVDEIEKGFGLSEKSGTASRVFGSFLTWLSEKKAEVFVVATANDISQLPPELLRRGRFDEVFFIDLPNVHERLEILRIHLTRRKRCPEAFPGLASLAERAEHFSGAELEQVVVAALHRAFALQRDVTDEDLAFVLQRSVPLYATYEESIKSLRDWARTRARPATVDASVLDLFDAEKPTAVSSLKNQRGWPIS
ncbi:MAG: AAA family ATPase [Myxococcales bacterium]|nr:AAA family ATPase [Myxococcales bacterium]